MNQWMPLVSLLISVSTLGIAWLAFRRTGVFQSRELRLRLRLDIAEVRALLLGSVHTLNNARQSHVNVLAAQGLGRSGNQQVFEQEADEHAEELTRLLNRLDEIDTGTNDSVVEAGLVQALSMRARVTQIADKYSGVLVQDDRAREALRREAIDRVARLRSAGEGEPPGT